MVEIRGIIPPVITPMNEDETVNEKELENQVNRLIDAGVHGIFAFGTNGEGYALDEEEKEQVLSAVIRTAAGRVPVYAGCGCVTTRDTIRMSQMAERLGADGAVRSLPHLSQRLPRKNCTAIIKRWRRQSILPIVLYNIPARTGNALAPATVERLAEIDNIVGAKDSSGNFDNMLQYIERTKEKNFSVLSGNDSLILWNLLAGGTGEIAGMRQCVPRKYGQHI